VNLLENFRLFNEAAILLMKRKFQEAISVFNQLQVHQASFDDFLLPLYHQFKAYGYFCLGKHKEAIIEYQCLDYQTKDQISCFNQHLCEGIVEAERKHYEEGINFFRKAKDVFPNKVEPYIYTAVTFVREINDLIRHQPYSHELEQKRQAAVLRAMDEMNSGNLINDANSNLLYHRAILCYYFRDFKRGLDDINRCIEKAEDNIPKYFFLRGLGYACTRDPGKAISEFSICVSL
jgi:tetratricopeptide (TPR) repeat protein